MPLVQDGAAEPSGSVKNSPPPRLNGSAVGNRVPPLAGPLRLPAEPAERIALPMADTRNADEGLGLRGGERDAHLCATGRLATPIPRPDRAIPAGAADPVPLPSTRRLWAAPLTRLPRLRLIAGASLPHPQFHAETAFSAGMWMPPAAPELVERVVEPRFSAAGVMRATPQPCLPSVEVLWLGRGGIQARGGWQSAAGPEPAEAGVAAGFVETLGPPASVLGVGLAHLPAAMRGVNKLANWPIAGPVEVAAADPVECLALAVSGLVPAAQAPAVTPPRFDLGPADGLSQAEIWPMAGPAEVAAADPVECLALAVSGLAPAAQAPAVTPPRFDLGPADGLSQAEIWPMAGPAEVAAADPVECLALAVSGLVPAAQAPAVTPPRFDLGPADGLSQAEIWPMAGPAEVAAADPVECLALAVSGLVPAAQAPVVTPPQFHLQPVDGLMTAEVRPVASPAEVPAADPVECLALAVSGLVAAAEAAGVTLPQFHLQPVDGLMTAEVRPVAGPAEVPAADPVECVAQAVSGLVAAAEAAGVTLPRFDLQPVDGLNTAEVRPVAGLAQVPTADPVECLAAPASALVPVAHAPAVSPAQWALHVVGDMNGAVNWPMAGPIQAPAAAPVECVAVAVSAVVPMASAPALALRQFVILGPQSNRAALAGHAPVVAQPQARRPESGSAMHQALVTVAPLAPQSGVTIPRTGLPQPELVPLDFHCARGTRPIASRPASVVRALPVSLPVFALRIALERVEEIATSEKKRNPLAFAEIFSGAGRGRRSHARSVLRRAITTIAASLVVGSMLWLGLNSIRHVPSMNRDASADAAAPSASASSPGSQSGNGGSSSASAKAPGLLERVRLAVANRAASEITDSFHGMEAWGASTKSWASGWSRHPDGFVRPGQLALFRPSASYTDYRLEFFGQIERKAMNWVVRAKDSQNYYAMKFAVVEPGLRPMIAMVHYPVVGGKRGHRVAVPLSVMVHNDTAYHVAVEVRGNHIVTSIEGQEVDTWIDDTLPKGGVGFFAEAGEKSRLYWMKVSRNEDFLGRICALLSDRSGGNAAELWPPAQFPSGSGRQPEPAPDAALSAAVLLFGRNRFYSLKFLNNRRFPTWNS